MDPDLAKAAESIGATIDTMEVTLSDDPGNDTLTLSAAGGETTYTLKPLGQLYGEGVNAETVDPQSDEYEPLFLTIEQGVVAAYIRQPSLRDGQVLLAYQSLQMRPEDPGADPVARLICRKIRVHLSLSDYSRYDVRAVLKRLVKSVQLHKEMAGLRGYLDFVREYVPL